MNCPKCNASEEWVEEDYPDNYCLNCNHVWDVKEVAEAKAKITEDDKLKAKLQSGLFATHSPEAKEETEEAQVSFQERMEQEASQKISLTFLGGNLAHYKEWPNEVQCEVRSEEHWLKMIEKAKANAKAGHKKLVVVNPNRDSNPYEAGCPREEYDYGK